MKQIDIKSIYYLLLVCIIIQLATSSCMNKKRCPGVHRYTTAQSGGGGKGHHGSAHFGGGIMKDSRLKGTGIAYHDHGGTSKRKYSTTKYGGTSLKDSKLKGTGIKYHGGMMVDRRESPKQSGNAPWTKSYKRQNKQKAKSGIIPKNLKKPPTSKKKKSTTNKSTKNKYNQ